MANSEACDLYIEQQIQDGLEVGKTPYAIGQELAGWLEKLFETQINPRTLTKKAERQQAKIATFVANDSTLSNDSESDGKQDKPVIVRNESGQFAAGTKIAGPGRPPKFRVVKNNEHFRTSVFTGDDDWYTPMKYIDAARSVMGEIDLDPATSEYGQSRIQAKKYYIIKDDGLTRSWHGRIWMNPPYSQPTIARFIDKFRSEYEKGNIKQGIVLTNNNTDTSWFHRLEKISGKICFTLGRIRFEKQDGEKDSPVQGQAFFYVGENIIGFEEIFGKFGFIR